MQSLLIEVSLYTIEQAMVCLYVKYKELEMSSAIYGNMLPLSPTAFHLAEQVELTLEA
jgi:hypothetical protein